MSLRPPSRVLAIAPFLVGIAAMTGLVHVATVLTFPGRARHDAFSRISDLPLNAVADLPRDGSGPFPFRDAALAAAVCRFDLAQGPVQIAVSPDGANLLAIGMHSRHGTAFYGLSLHPGEGRAFVMTLMTDAQNTAANGADKEDGPAGELNVLSPEPEGFVLFETPAHGAVAGRGALADVSCGRAAQTPRD